MKYATDGVNDIKAVANKENNVALIDFNNDF
jgi:hypothetical protein